LVVTITAAFVARSAINWNISLLAVSASGTKPSSSMQSRSSRSHRPSARLSWVACAASASSLISPVAVVDRTGAAGGNAQARREMRLAGAYLAELPGHTFSLTNASLMRSRSAAPSGAAGHAKRRGQFLMSSGGQFRM
jgi:hypothetical protein